MLFFVLLRVAEIAIPRTKSNSESSPMHSSAVFMIPPCRNPTSVRSPNGGRRFDHAAQLRLLLGERERGAMPVAREPALRREAEPLERQEGRRFVDTPPDVVDRF